MKCSSCFREWKTDPKQKEPETCPFCGQKQNSRPDPQEKAPFFFTWGLIIQDNMKKAGKRATAADFDQALDYYSKALDESLQYAAEVADFAVQWPQFQDHLSVLKNRPFIESFSLPDDSQNIILSLYLEGMKHLKPGVPAKMTSWLKKQFPDTEEGKQSVLKVLGEAVYSKGTWQEHEEYYDSLNAAAALLQHQYGLAATYYKKLAGADENTRLIVSGSRLLEELSGIPADPEKRTEYISVMTEQKNLSRLLLAIVQPAADSQNEYVHQSRLSAETINLIRESMSETRKILKTMLEKQALLSGSHLFMQQLSSQDEQFREQLKDLLDLHYEKVYMKPYSWIRESDFVIDPEILK